MECGATGWTSHDAVQEVNALTIGTCAQKIILGVFAQEADKLHARDADNALPPLALCRTVRFRFCLPTKGVFKFSHDLDGKGDGRSRPVGEVGTVTRFHARLSHVRNQGPTLTEFLRSDLGIIVKQPSVQFLAI